MRRTTRMKGAIPPLALPDGTGVRGQRSGMPTVGASSADDGVSDRVGKLKTLLPSLLRLTGLLALLALFELRGREPCGDPLRGRVIETVNG